MADDKLATQSQNTAMARPDFLKGDDHRGTEHIAKDDMQMPRLLLAQGLSPQLDPNSPKYIDALKNGQLFNSLSGTVYGKDPIKFYVVRADAPRWVEFIPREQGGGIKDPNVKFGDPRTQFRTDDAGKPLPPIATKFYDYVLMFAEDGGGLWKQGELIALSLKSTGIKVAKALNTFIKMKNAPCFAGVYSIGVSSEKNTKGTYNVYALKDLGFVQDKALYDKLGEVFEALKDKDLKLDREDGDDTDFPHGANAPGADEM
jgi:hypothetical protein